MTALFDLTGRVALVTGGNGGIGLGLAEGLAACGARVVVAGRDAAKNAAAVARLGGDASDLVADLTEPAAAERVVDATLARAGRLDILVNNAGGNRRLRPETVSDADWAAVLELNLHALMRLTRAAYPALKASGHGRVINVGSILSLFGAAFSPAYGASKGAVVQYTKSCAVAWAADGITVNAILPGWVDTELTQGARRDVPGLNENVLARTPLKRWGRPEDFRGVAAFLASDAAAFVTGAAIVVDGGFASQG
jgi:2-deoxy-D-gluconate 3-dehydrogenase